MGRKFCPQCGGAELRRSRTRGFRERTWKVLGWRAYRCRNKECQWRGLLKARSFKEVLEEYWQKNNAKIIISVTAFCGIILFIIMLKWFLK